MCKDCGKRHRFEPITYSTYWAATVLGVERKQLKYYEWADCNDKVVFRKKVGKLSPRV